MSDILTRIVFLLACIFMPLNLAAVAQPVLGMARSGLHEQGVEQAIKELSQMKSLGIRWVRFGPRSNEQHDLENLAKVAKAANGLGVRILLNILQLDSDYDGPLYKNACGWNGKALSKINVDKLAARIRGLFSTLHQFGALIDAVEVGNELDQECYDAGAGEAEDINSRKWLRGYARFLQIIGIELKREGGYPQAKIVTFGITQVPDSVGSPPHVVRPVEKLLELASLDGHNYLTNSRYKVDGIGIHVYASPSRLNDDIDRLLIAKLRLIPENYSLWVTEWGFLNLSDFNDKKPLKPHLCSFLKEFGRLDTSRIGPIFFYSFDGWLVDEKGRFTTAACAFSTNVARRDLELPAVGSPRVGALVPQCC